MLLVISSWECWQPRLQPISKVENPSLDIDECDPDDPKHDCWDISFCENTVGSFNCSYECKPKCKDNAVCVLENSEAVCRCLEGYEGVGTVGCWFGFPTLGFSCLRNLHGGNFPRCPARNSFFYQNEKWQKSTELSLKWIWIFTPECVIFIWGMI